MQASLPNRENDYSRKLKWLMFFRVIFAALLLGSTVFFRLRNSLTIFDPPLLILYTLITGIMALSLFYSLLFRKIKRKVIFAYIQLSIDTVSVTLIIFVTGSFSSIFQFLYLIIIICGSMFLLRNGSVLLAGFCSIQYSMMVALEVYGIVDPFGMESRLIIANYELTYVLYKVCTTIIACFLVAFLSSFLAEQERKSRIELSVMEENVKRVEKMAAMGEMAAGLAHEIKNPLAALSGAIQLLKEDTQFDDDQDKLMQIVLREADRLSSLVSEFLLFAKPQQGNPEIIRLDKTIEETIGLFKQDDSCRGRITFIKKIPSDLFVKMDSGHLRQVLWNLLLNAAEAIEGSGTICIDMYSQSDGLICVKVADDGCGISNETIQSIFDPFFTTKKSGTGLGLSIVHRLLESYGGRLDVVSEPGKGSTFSLMLKQIESH